MQVGWGRVAALALPVRERGCDMNMTRAIRAGGCVLAAAAILGVLAGVGATGLGGTAGVRHGVAFAAAEAELPAWAGGHACVECHEEQVPAGAEKPGDSGAAAKGDGASANKDAAPKPNTGASASKNAGQEAQTASDGKVSDSSSSSEKITSKEAQSAASDQESGEAAVPLMELHAGLDCMLCHPDNDDMDYAHWGVDVDSSAPEKLKYSKVDSAVCLACHKDDAVPKVTQDVDALTDTGGVTVNPHNLPDPEGAHASVGCANCHVMHAGTTPEEAAYQRCIDCHHVEVWGCACHDE